MSQSCQRRTKSDKVSFVPPTNSITSLFAFLFTFVAAANAAPKPDGQVPIVVGLQLHSLRVELAKDLPATLAEVEKWGITDVELGALFNLTPQQFRKELDAHHLRATGIHFQWHQLLTDIDGAIRDAKILGCDYITLPWIPHKGAFTADDAKNACEKFNEWGKSAPRPGCTSPITRTVTNSVRTKKASFST